MAPVVADDCQYAGRCETEGREHLTAAPGSGCHRRAARILHFVRVAIKSLSGVPQRGRSLAAAVAE
jgi:hypothetical protein